MEIKSRKNPKVQLIVGLKNKKQREECGLYLVEGIKSVREAFLRGAEVVTVLGTEEIVSDFYNSGAEVLVTTKEIADYCSDSKTPQGVVAAVKIPDNRLIAPLSNCILLDGLQDPGNVGTIIRTACAAGIKDIYLIDSADPFSPKCVRASMSGIFSVSVHSGGYDEILKCLQGVPIILADMNGKNVFTYCPPDKFCLAVGSEGHGLSRVVRELQSDTVKIPMESTMESLNAGVSASIILYQLIQRQKGE